MFDALGLSHKEWIELPFLLLLWGLSDTRIAQLREMPRSFSIKLHSETQVSARMGMSGDRSPRHAQNPLSGERRKALSITHHATHPIKRRRLCNRVSYLLVVGEFTLLRGYTTKWDIHFENKWIYSRTCYEQPPLWHMKSGLLRQVAAHRRFICIGNAILGNGQRAPIEGWLLKRVAAHSRFYCMW